MRAECKHEQAVGTMRAGIALTPEGESLRGNQHWCPVCGATRCSVGEVFYDWVLPSGVPANVTRMAERASGTLHEELRNVG